MIPNNLAAAEPKENHQIKSEQWIEVLVDSPGAQGIYVYRIDHKLNVKPGDIVSVPFGMQLTGGIAVNLLDLPPKDLAISKIRPIESVITSSFFSNTYWQLLTTIADYYYTDLINVIKVALPPGLLERSQRRVKLNSVIITPDAEAFCSVEASQVLQLLQSQKDGDYSVNYLRNQVKGASRGIRELSKRGWIENYLEPPKRVKPKLKTAVTLTSTSLLNDLTSRQAEILQVLKNRGGELWLKELIGLCKTTSATVKKLESKNYVVLADKEILRQERGIHQVADNPKQLSQDQANALAVINTQQNFAQILLHGVTGSGKTEVYIQAIAPILEQGKSALVLVPEIGLTPQLTDRFRARFGEKVCIYHSKLSDGERYDTWRQTIRGESQVVIGTRSAIFAPLPNLGLIVLDEEHDSSFKQDRPAPTYHARTVATWRAELENCPLVLGSATPSLESLVSARDVGIVRELPLHHQSTKFYLSLPNRIANRPLPQVSIIDLRQELSRGNRSIFSLFLQKAIAEMQEQGQQGILFIPRRGHSTFVSCRSCGYVMECPDCDVSLSYHYSHEGAAKLLRCHYCNHTRIQPKICPECSSPYLKFFGSGTQKVTQELAKLFPELRCIRFDSDTTRNKGAHRQLIDRFIHKEADLLIGTQMLTKGLDIAGVTVVGIIAADGLLHRSDYRAAERAFQTLTQVAGRAGRGNLPGKVIVQTYSPDHPVIQAVKTHNYQDFSQTELSQREELNYPPYGNLILLKFSSINAQEVEKAAETGCDCLTEMLSHECEILGPAPANIMRVARRYRWQILIKFPNTAKADLPDLNQLRSHIPKTVSMTIDVDPVNID